MLKHYGLEKEDMREKCSQDTLKNVATKLTNWQLDPLDLGSVAVSTIIMDFKSAQLQQKEYVMKWSTTLHMNATYEELARKLLAARNAALAGEVCEGCKKAVGE